MQKKSIWVFGTTDQQEKREDKMQLKCFFDHNCLQKKKKKEDQPSPQMILCHNELKWCKRNLKASCQLLKQDTVQVQTPKLKNLIHTYMDYFFSALTSSSLLSWIEKSSLTSSSSQSSSHCWVTSFPSSLSSHSASYYIYTNKDTTNSKM